MLISDVEDGPLAKSVNLTLAIPRGARDRVAMHGGTLVGLEAVALALASADRDSAIGALDRLNAVRVEVSWQRFNTG